MKSIHILSLITVASAAAISAAAQGIEITSITNFTWTNDANFTVGSAISSNQTLAEGSTISDLGVSAWAAGSYTAAGSYKQASRLATVDGTATGGDDFGRMAVTMEYTDFGSPYSAGTTLWYAQTVVNGNVAAQSTKSGTYSYTPSQSLRVMDGDTIYLGISATDNTYNNATSKGHGATFLISNAPDVTISGGTAAWSILDNSAADTDLGNGTTMIDRNGGLLNLSYTLDALSAQRALVQNFAGSAGGSPFQDAVLATLTLQITGENASGLVDTFDLGSTNQTVTFLADANNANFDFGLISGSSSFDPSEWADGDFTLTYSVVIDQLAYGHDNAYLGSQVLGSLSASQSFSLFTGATAVPEPSTYAAILGFVAFGAVIYTRRKTKASTVQA